MFTSAFTLKCVWLDGDKELPASYNICLFTYLLSDNLQLSAVYPQRNTLSPYQM